MVAVFCADTPKVVTWKVAPDAPPTNVTVFGTVATVVKELERLTTTPALPAGPFRVTIPVEGLPPVTAVGLRLSEVSITGLIVKIAVRVLVATVALIVAIEDAVTDEVLIAKVAEVAPAGTVTLAGTAAFDELELKVTASP